MVKLKDGSSAVTSRELTIQYIYNANYWYVSSLARREEISLTKTWIG